jgi:hypothetical protein
MTTSTRPRPDDLEAAEFALRWVFSDLRFAQDQVTPEAALYAFRVMKKVDVGSRAAYGLFQLTQLPLNVRSWSDIPREIYGAVREAMKQPGKPMKSRIALAFIARQHQRLLQHHLNDPETHPCPDFSDKSLWF